MEQGSEQTSETARGTSEANQTNNTSRANHSATTKPSTSPATNNKKHNDIVTPAMSFRQVEIVSIAVPKLKWSFGVDGPIGHKKPNSGANNPASEVSSSTSYSFAAAAQASSNRPPMLQKTPINRTSPLTNDKAETNRPRAQDDQFSMETRNRSQASSKVKELVAWEDDQPSLPSETLDSMGRVGAWDQFAANEEKYGITTSFDENLYTTKLDRTSNAYKAYEKTAARLAHEIETVSFV